MAVTHRATSGVEVELTFAVSSEISRFRGETFSTKEPETLQWIEEFGGRGAFYDIGANVGQYALYNSKIHGCPTYAFEASALNLPLLARNIAINGASNVIVIPLALSDKNMIGTFRLSTTEEGGALSAFNVAFDFNGDPLQVAMEYHTLGVTLDRLLAEGFLPDPPTIMKIDVDGIEHLILRGARETLNNPSLQSVMVEVNDDFEQQAHEVNRLLTAAGFVLRQKCHSEMFSEGAFGSTFNQAWVRS